MPDKDRTIEYQLDDIRQLFTGFEPRVTSDETPRKSAAVCIILSKKENDDALSLLMIRRAKYKGDPWSGHMAFPGGRLEESDVSLKDAALRELSEELSVSEGSLEYVGRLSDIHAKFVPRDRQLVLSSFVFFSHETLNPIKNEEVAAFYWIPLSFFIETRRKKMWWMRKLRMISLPYYRYETKRVWGLSLALIDELFGVLERPISHGRSRRLYQRKKNKKG